MTISMCFPSERERNIATVRITNPLRLVTSSRLSSQRVFQAPLRAPRAGSVREAEASAAAIRATRTRDFENRCDTVTSHTILREPVAGTNAKIQPPSSPSFPSSLPKSLHYLLKKP